MRKLSKLHKAGRARKSCARKPSPSLRTVEDYIKFLLYDNLVVDAPSIYLPCIQATTKSLFWRPSRQPPDPLKPAWSAFCLHSA
jgi:hypothetical protein